MGRGTKTADLLAECDEDFLGRVVFVGEGNEHALSVSRRDRSQREHVASDNVLLDLGDVEITLGIFAGNVRVMEAVELLELDLMPVVKEIIVEKGASDELLLLEAEGEDHGPEQSSLGHSDTVVIAGALAVLLVLFKLVQPSGLKNRLGKVFEKNVTLD